MNTTRPKILKLSASAPDHLFMNDVAAGKQKITEGNKIYLPLTYRSQEGDQSYQTL